MTALDQRLVDAAIAEIDRRFPHEIGIAAALYTDEGEILIGVRFRPILGLVRLCAETEPILMAHRLQKTITASVCVYREPQDGRYLILAPCGVCQERLIYWGQKVQVAVPHLDDPTRWQMKTLDMVNPHHWADVLP